MILPFVQEMAPAPAVDVALQALARRPGLILFDSSSTRLPLGRYSFLAADPFETVEVPHAQFRHDPFTRIEELSSKFVTNTVQGLPPFQGGVAGILTYELGQCFERLPVAPRDEMEIPAAVMGIYSWVFAWDHQQQRCWFISHGYPEQQPEDRLKLARQQYEQVREDLSRLVPESAGLESVSVAATASFHPHDVELPQLLPGLRSNFSHEQYRRAVQRVIDYIRAGDIFQANLSQRFVFPARRGPLQQYLTLRKTNPAPFAGYFAHADWAMMSSSPERFLQVGAGEVSTRPIKGTRQRRSIPEADLYTRDELRESEKDRAENVMIVDLLRNDLSRVCNPGSIRVTELCTVEAYETVSHLVSEVRGTLRESTSFFDLLKATFPGGSITGAPKIRAMQIITELEQVARGPYCGSMFYCGFDGTADSNILIRTMTQRQGMLTFSAGGGIVAQSDPQLEYEETLHKARGMLNSLR